MWFAKFPDPDVDLADAGFSALQAVGSIGAASNQLALTSNPGFEVGDTVIVEIGGEAGAGQRGTVGVGGVWPSVHYANLAAIEATTPSDTSYAYAEDTLKTYQYLSGDWFEETRYYPGTIVPLALVAEITNVAGNVLTLDTPAVAAATNANVYYDNKPAFDAVVSDHSEASFKMRIPVGDFAVSSQLTIDDKTGWILTGFGSTVSKLFSPRGAPAVSLIWDNCTGCVSADFHVQGNVKQQGYMWGLFGVTTPNQWGGHQFDNSEHCTAYRVNATDVWTRGVGTSRSFRCYFYNCKVTVTDPKMGYIQWEVQFADSYDCWSVDCEVDSNYLVPGFEHFRSDYGGHIRPVSRNGIFSVNSSGAGIIDSPIVVVEADSSQPGDDVNSTSNFALSPLFNINSNIQPPSSTIELGYTIRNPTITQEGPVDDDGTVLAAININDDNPNVTITGTYPSGSSGHIVYPTYSKNQGAINSSGDATVVDGIRMQGSNTNEFWGDIVLRGAATSIVRNCVADTILVLHGTTSNNQTNAAFES